MEQGVGPPVGLPHGDLAWALGSVCALHRLPFSADLLAREFPPPFTRVALIAAARALGLRVKQIALARASIERQVFPLLVALERPAAESQDPSVPSNQPLLGIVTAARDGQVVLFRSGTNTPVTLGLNSSLWFVLRIWDVLCHCAMLRWN